MRAILRWIGLFLAQVGAAFAQDTLPNVNYPFQQAAIQPNALNFNAPELPLGDGFLWIVSVGHVGMSHALGGHFCGGSLIAPLWVLTAVHCVKRVGPQADIMDANKIQIKIGYELDKPGKIYHVEKLIVNPNYQVTVFNTLLNDIALIKLDTAVT